MEWEARCCLIGAVEVRDRDPQNPALAMRVWTLDRTLAKRDHPGGLEVPQMRQNHQLGCACSQMNAARSSLAGFESFLFGGCGGSTKKNLDSLARCTCVHAIRYPVSMVLYYNSTLYPTLSLEPLSLLLLLLLLNASTLLCKHVPSCSSRSMPVGQLQCFCLATALFDDSQWRSFAIVVIFH